MLQQLSKNPSRNDGLSHKATKSLAQDKDPESLQAGGVFNNLSDDASAKGDKFPKVNRCRQHQHHAGKMHFARRLNLKITDCSAKEHSSTSSPSSQNKAINSQNTEKLIFQSLNSDLIVSNHEPQIS